MLDVELLSGVAGVLAGCGRIRSSEPWQFLAPSLSRKMSCCSTTVSESAPNVSESAHACVPLSDSRSFRTAALSTQTTSLMQVETIRRRVSCSTCQHLDSSFHAPRELLILPRDHPSRCNLPVTPDICHNTDYPPRTFQERSKATRTKSRP